MSVLKNDNSITVTPIESETFNLLLVEEEKAVKLLEVKETDNPCDVVTKIMNYIEELLQGEHNSEAIENYAIQLGALWGRMVINELNWTYKTIDFGNGQKSFYLVSPEEYFCCNPLYFINKILTEKNIGLDGNNDNTVLLLFNMMRDIDNQKPKTKYQAIS